MPLIDAVTIQAVMVQLDPCITDVHQIMTSVTMFFRVETSDGPVTAQKRQMLLKSRCMMCRVIGSAANKYKTAGCTIKGQYTHASSAVTISARSVAYHAVQVGKWHAAQQSRFTNNDWSYSFDFIKIIDMKGLPSYQHVVWVMHLHAGRLHWRKIVIRCILQTRPTPFRTQSNRVKLSGL
jgi:hypothetical protein